MEEKDFFNEKTETKAAEIAKKILEEVQAGKPFESTVATVVASCVECASSSSPAS